MLEENGQTDRRHSNDYFDKLTAELIMPPVSIPMGMVFERLERTVYVPILTLPGNCSRY
jgi:hypothetical protein